MRLSSAFAEFSDPLRRTLPRGEKSDRGDEEDHPSEHPPNRRFIYGGTSNVPGTSDVSDYSSDVAQIQIHRPYGRRSFNYFLGR